MKSKSEDEINMPQLCIRFTIENKIAHLVLNRLQGMNCMQPVQSTGTRQ